MPWTQIAWWLLLFAGIVLVVGGAFVLGGEVFRADADRRSTVAILGSGVLAIVVALGVWPGSQRDGGPGVEAAPAMVDTTLAPLDGAPPASQAPVVVLTAPTSIVAVAPPTAAPPAPSAPPAVGGGDVAVTSIAQVPAGEAPATVVTTVATTAATSSASTSNSATTAPATTAAPGTTATPGTTAAPGTTTATSPTTTAFGTLIVRAGPFPCDGRWLVVFGSTNGSATRGEQFFTDMQAELDDDTLVLLDSELCASMTPGNWLVVAPQSFRTSGAAVNECIRRGRTDEIACMAMMLTDDPADRGERAFP